MLLLLLLELHLLLVAPSSGVEHLLVHIVCLHAHTHKRIVTTVIIIG